MGKQRDLSVLKNPTTGETAVRLGNGEDNVIIPWKVENDWLKLGLVSTGTVVKPGIKSLEFPLGTPHIDDEFLFSNAKCIVRDSDGNAKQEDYTLLPYPELVLNTVKLLTRSMNNKVGDGSLSWLTVSDLRRSVSEGRIYSGVSLIAYAHLEASGFLNRGIYEGELNE